MRNSGAIVNKYRWNAYPHASKSSRRARQASMPFCHQILIISTKLSGVRRTGCRRIPPDSGLTNIKCMDSGCDATLIFSAEWVIRLNTLPGLRFPAIFGYQRFRPLSSHRNCKRPSNDMLFCETPLGVFLLSAGTIDVDSESDEANATANLMP